MRPGMIVQLRINPSTAQSVVDVLEAAGALRDDMSFPTCVSRALNILIETAKKSELIPEPDPYEYINKVGRFHNTDFRKASKKNLPTLNKDVFGDSPVISKTVHPVPEVEEELSAEEAKSRDGVLRLNELVMKKECAAAGLAGFEWTAEDQQLYEDLGGAK